MPNEHFLGSFDASTTNWSLAAVVTSCCRAPLHADVTMHTKSQSLPTAPHVQPIGMTVQDVPPYVPAASIALPPLVFVSTVAVTTEACAPFAATLVLHVIAVASAATPAAATLQVRISLVLSAVQIADCAVLLSAALKAHADTVSAAAQITLSAVMTIVFVLTSAVPKVCVKTMLAGTAPAT